MMLYILKSMLCMAVLLGFFHLVLERQKMPMFNRFYLLVGTVFSTIAPLVTVRYLVLPNVQGTISTITSGEIITSTAVEGLWYGNLDNIALIIYLTIALLMIIRLLYNIATLIHKTKLGTQISKAGSTLVLLPQDVLPHSFFKYIFLSKTAYENGEIDDMLLAHETAHVRQAHSWDIIFIEIVHALLWFNPLLIIYKKAIRLNHEVLADDAVITKHKEVSTYQYLLIDTIKSCSTMNLASSLNYSFTKKRLNMMNKKSSRLSTYFSGIVCVPLFVMLLVVVGQTGYAQETSDEESWAVVMARKSMHFQNATIVTSGQDGQMIYKKFSALTPEEKAMLPPPPPPSPAGDLAGPLPEGTLVFLGENGKVRLGDNGLPIPPPPPPPAPKAPTVAPPPPPPAPPTLNNIPPPPPPPPSPVEYIEDLIERGATFKYDGKEITGEKARKIAAEATSKLSIKLNENGGKKPIVTIKN